MSKHEANFIGIDERPDRRQLVGLLLLLSVIAGSTDAIGFIGLSLFTAHITGNIVVLVSHLAAHGKAGIAEMISVPVFMAALFVLRWLGLVLDRRYAGSTVRVLLILQFGFLLAFLLLSLPLGWSFDPDALWAVLAGMCGVGAMATQSTLVQVALPGAPSTGAMTNDIAKFAVAAVEALYGSPAVRQVQRTKVGLNFSPIAGFIAGAAIGGFLAWRFGLAALILPVLLALAAIPIGMSCDARGTDVSDERLTPIDQNLAVDAKTI